MNARRLFPTLGMLCAVLLQSLEVIGGSVPTSDELESSPPQRPVIAKKGTVDLDLCETSPFVFKGRLYRLEWKRPHDFMKGHGYLRVMDHETQAEVARFGDSQRFPCAYVENDTVYVFGTSEDKGWCGTTLTVFTSKDLTNWNGQVAFHDAGFEMCNTTVCKAGDRYVMSVEVHTAGGEPMNGSYFAGRFLESKDMIHWTLTPKDCRMGFDGKTKSPHFIRWQKGWFYLFSTVGGDPKGYVLLLERSRDLKTWEACPFNPVMFAEPEDKLIANPKLTEAQRGKIAKATDCDNSDIDFCEFNGRLIINYCWGNQVGTEFIAEAEYAGTEAQFLEGWFPDMGAWAGIDCSRPLSMFARHRTQFGRVLSATGATVRVSSVYPVVPRDIQRLLSGSGDADFAFHTNPETNPWVTIDLGREAALTGVLVRNRIECCQERAENLRLCISHDGVQWTEVWKAGGIEPVWEIMLPGTSSKARYLRLDTQHATPAPFHLQHVEVWGKE